MEPTIHYNPFLKLTTLLSEGEGWCGERGRISGYQGAIITCTACLELIAEETCQITRDLSRDLSNHLKERRLIIE